MDHKDLDVWKASVELAVAIYEVTKYFPKEELYGLTSQIRRAAISVASNIADGAARNGDKEMIQYLYIYRVGFNCRDGNTVDYFRKTYVYRQQVGSIE